MGEYTARIMSAGDTLEQHALAAVMAGIWRGRHLLHSCLGSTAQLQQQSKKLSAHRCSSAAHVREDSSHNSVPISNVTSETDETGVGYSNTVTWGRSESWTPECAVN